MKWTNEEMDAVKFTMKMAKMSVGYQTLTSSHTLGPIAIWIIGVSFGAIILAVELAHGSSKMKDEGLTKYYQ